MKKKITIIGVLLLALIAFPRSAKAEAMFDFQCDPSSPERGKTTNCTLSVENSQEAITKVRLQITAEDMTLADFVPNPTNFTSSGSKDAEGFVLLTAKNSAGFMKGPIGSISATVNSDAAKCGKICVMVYYYVDGSDVELTGLNKDGGKCQELTPPSTPQTPTQPPTGSFASYAVLVGGAAIALGIITFASRKTKFYRV